MYNLGFGKNLNYNFLETMALQNHGLARRIYEDSDANLQLQVCFTSRYFSGSSSHCSVATSDLRGRFLSLEICLWLPLVLISITQSCFLCKPDRSNIRHPVKRIRLKSNEQFLCKYAQILHRTVVTESAIKSI